MPARWERSRWALVALLLLTSVIREAATGQAFGPPRQAMGSLSPLPANLVVPGIMRPLLTSMWSLSPTFRRQCARLAEHPEIRVRIDFLARVHTGRASALVERSDGSYEASAEIDVSTPALYVEHIAHELEHVLEALDGADLPRLARQRVDGVMDLGGKYETARAQAVGRMVAHEVMP
jgi:hypothetical protein